MVKENSAEKKSKELFNECVSEELVTKFKIKDKEFYAIKATNFANVIELIQSKVGIIDLLENTSLDVIKKEMEEYLDIGKAIKKELTC